MTRAAVFVAAAGAGLIFGPVFVVQITAGALLIRSGLRGMVP